jgi:hypothetical protein
MASQADDLTLADVLGAVDEFSAASRGLVAWELTVSEVAIELVWLQAVQQRLLYATGATDLGEPTYQLTLAGRARLRELRRVSVGSGGAE